MVAEDLISSLPVELTDKINDLVILLQAVGILAVVYLIWMAIKSFLTLKMNKKINEMHSDIKSIKKKLKIK